jgi:hypothetical protein
MQLALEMFLGSSAESLLSPSRVLGSQLAAFHNQVSKVNYGVSWVVCPFVLGGAAETVESHGLSLLRVLGICRVMYVSRHTTCGVID